jgi:heptaprenyl diphosphate synthase
MSLTARSAARLGLLVAVAATLQIAESLVPKPLPWLRLGLANAVTLFVLVRVGFSAALAVALLRVLLSGLLLGTLGSPPFLLSAAGGTLACLAMAIALRAASPPLSLLGVSVVGAAAHGVGQLAVLGVLVGGGEAILALAPVLLASAVPLGLLTGALVVAVHHRVGSW